MSEKVRRAGSRTRLYSSAIFAMALAAPAAAHAAATYTIANNTPKLIQSGTLLGAADPASVIDVTLWLNLHNRSELDAVTKALYDPTSPRYRHWLDRETLVARYAPTADEIKQVSAFAISKGLSITLVDKANFFVRTRGTVAAMERAFNVTISRYATKAGTIRANASDPQIADPAGALIRSVGGLDSSGYTHPLAQQTALLPPKGGAAGKSSVVSPNVAAAAPTAYTSACFKSPTTEAFSSSGYPVGVYTGNGYAGSTTSDTAGCGYTPPEIQAAYNLTALYNEGYNGAGQTIAILDWCGSLTIQHDANVFSAAFGLPLLSSSNFSIINYPQGSTCAGPDPEINIDVEWAHAIAPGANIDLIVPPSASFDDVNSGLLFIIENGLANVISNSYGSEELYTPLATLEVENSIAEVAAALGISANFASGDDGDFTFGYPQYDPPSVSAPADSPYATSVGGVSLALTATNGIAWQAGWGTNETLLVDEGTVFDPPFNFGFGFGAGGGPSGVFAKPSFQSKLYGPARLVPDIAWLADPFTGGVITISEPAQSPATIYTVYGGTSLATPMFSALWAIANEEAGAPLGLAAAYVYTMPAGTISDVTPYGSSTNVSATIAKSASNSRTFKPNQIAAPLDANASYVSVMWNYPLTQDTLYAITFGTDGKLKTKTGWDDVTGVGVPNAKAFADFFKPAAP